MIGIIDYGLGNVSAFLNMYKRLNIEAMPARSSEDLKQVDRLILPGVGSFDHAMALLEASGMRATLDQLVLDQGVPALGVCVGMQLLGRSSEEGTAAGLGWISGTVKSLRRLPSEEQLPHMGWNDVQPAEHRPLFRGLEQGSRFYFLHSYYFDCDSADDVAATATYGDHFCCAVQKGNIHGAQFHPEKSHHFGARLLQNFAEV